MAQQFLDYAGLQEFWNKIKGFVATNYVTKESGKGLSTNDYTTAEKNKLTGIAEGAQVNVVDGAAYADANAGAAISIKDKEIQLPVDKTLSSESINPIQNKVVYTAINALASSIDNSVQEAAGDAYISTSLTAVGTGDKDGQKLTITATDALKTAINQVTTNKNNITTLTTAVDNCVQAAAGDTYISTSLAAVGTGDKDGQKLTITATDALKTAIAQVETNKNDIATLKGSVAGGVHFIGVVTELPSSAINGDVCIKGEKEYIYSKPEGSAGEWKELGDTTAEAQRLTEIEKSYVSSFGGQKGDITVASDSDAIGTVNFAVDTDKKLTGSVNVGTTSFGGKTGDITVASGSQTTGDVNFKMEDNQLTGTVVLPSIVNSIQVGDTTTIDMSLDTTTVGSPKITATAITETPTSGSEKLVTSGQVHTYVTNSINGLNSSVEAVTPVQGTAETTAVAVEKPFTMVTSVTQANGIVTVGTTELGPIPISAITALSTSLS